MDDSNKRKATSLPNYNENKRFHQNNEEEEENGSETEQSYVESYAEEEAVSEAEQPNVERNIEDDNDFEAGQANVERNAEFSDELEDAESNAESESESDSEDSVLDETEAPPVPCVDRKYILPQMDEFGNYLCVSAVFTRDDPDVTPHGICFSYCSKDPISGLLNPCTDTRLTLDDGIHLNWEAATVLTKLFKWLKRDYRELQMIAKNYVQHPIGDNVLYNGNQLCRGGFGAIYGGYDTLANREIVIKEQLHCKCSVDEAKILKRMQHSPFFPRIFAGVQIGEIHYISLQKLDKDLWFLRDQHPKRKFSIRCVANIAIQSIAAVKDMHESGFIHQDISPGNLMTGSPNLSRSRLYLIDIGLGCPVKKDREGNIVEPNCTPKFRGTLRYGSPNAHKPTHLSFRDDIYSLFYVLFDLGVGRLPWPRSLDQLAITDPPEGNRLMLEQKSIKYPPRLMLRYLPDGFLPFVEHMESLSFGEYPNYDLLTGCFREILQSVGSNIYARFDWEKANYDDTHEMQYLLDCEDTPPCSSSSDFE